jgi:hypothetical protein
VPNPQVPHANLKEDPTSTNGFLEACIQKTPQSKQCEVLDQNFQIKLQVQRELMGQEMQN